MTVRLPHPIPLSLPPSPDEHGHNDELKDTTEDKYHAEEHPDVKKRDVRDTRNTLSNLVGDISPINC